jgi:hypothetical protein
MLYDRQVTGNLQRELQTLESWAQTYPRDPYAPGIISDSGGSTGHAAGSGHPIRLVRRPLSRIYTRRGVSRAGRGKEAEAEFQKVLNHRGIVLADPISAVAHLQLGRAYALSGDNGKANAAYQQFLALWDHADEDVPVLKQAKAEYARLP